MIVDVNIKQLKLYMAELNNLIDEYEDIELNIFNQLKNSCINWRDNNSTIFENKISNEKVATNDFLLSLQENKTLFESVYNEYKLIGNKIHINLLKKDSIINTIDLCIVNVNKIITEFNKADKSFYYKELSMINKQKEKALNIKNNLTNLKEKISKLFYDIKIIEDKLSLKIAKLQDIKISKFDFDY